MTTTSEGVKTIKELLMDFFDLSEPMSVDERAYLLAACIDLGADLNLVRAELEESLAADMEEDMVPTQFGTLVRSRGGKRTNWNGEEVRKRIVSRFGPGIDPDTGEKLDPETLAARVAEDLADCGGLNRPSHGWKAGALKARSIPVNDVCEYQEGKLNVRFA